MPFGDFDAWQHELLLTGRFVQDGDISEYGPEAQARFERYLELADMVDGTEGPAAVRALIASLRAEDDHGAHEAAYGALSRFPGRDLVRGATLAVVDLLEIPRDNSGNVLRLLTLQADDEDLRTFRAAFGQLQPEIRASLAALIAQHEADEWLADERSIGRLRPANPAGMPGGSSLG
ncbi:hypothetical protein ACIGD1_18670 [Streptomyces sp. NPDC085612]|uniref:hypothetical protein n=1 Tax=Streptomyces sp. NPDC085612 TaxID=3365732 RepID=UPI0037D94EB2